MKFKQNDSVYAIVDNKIVEGTVFVILDSVIVVKLDNGELVKCPSDTVAPAKIAEPTEETKESEPVEKSEIIITPDEFKEITTGVVAKITKTKPLLGFAFMSILAEIHTALFFDNINENS